LHEHMGFDVIAWEFNYSLEYYANHEIRKDSLNHYPDKYYGFGWDASSSSASLIAYYKKTLFTDRPLIFAGFDFDRPPAGSYVLERIYHLQELDPALALDSNEKKIIDSLSGAIHGFTGNQYAMHFSQAGFKKSRNVIRSLKRKIIVQRHNILNKLDLKAYRTDSLIVESVLMDIELDSLGKTDKAKWNIMRDRNMATRIGWLLDEEYPDKKIIIWSATAHLVRNDTAIVRSVNAGMADASYRPYKQAGDYIADKIGESMYTIAFTSHHGETGDILKDKSYAETIPVPEVNSFEYLAHRTNEKYLFTDIRSASPDCWLAGKFTACPLGYNTDTAQWRKLIDAFFFIDEMKPVKHRKLTKQEK